MGPSMLVLILCGLWRPNF